MEEWKNELTELSNPAIPYPTLPFFRPSMRGF